jgi:hypothetical protein
MADYDGIIFPVTSGLAYRILVYPGGSLQVNGLPLNTSGSYGALFPGSAYQFGYRRWFGCSSSTDSDSGERFLFFLFFLIFQK